MNYTEVIGDLKHLFVHGSPGKLLPLMSHLAEQTQRGFETFYDEKYLCETLCFLRKITGALNGVVFWAMGD